MRQDAASERCPFTANELAETTYRSFAVAWKKVHNEDRPEWGKMGGDSELAWYRAVEALVPIIENADGIPWVKLTSMFNEVYRSSMGDQGIPYEQMSQKTALCWEVAVRHLSNFLDSEQGDIDNAGDHEQKWGKWIEDRLTTLGESIERIQDAQN